MRQANAQLSGSMASQSSGPMTDGQDHGSANMSGPVFQVDGQGSAARSPLRSLDISSFFHLLAAVTGDSIASAVEVLTFIVELFSEERLSEEGYLLQQGPLQLETFWSKDRVLILLKVGRALLSILELYRA